MNALESVQNDIETLLSAEDYETEDLGSLYEYGLGFYPVPYDEDEAEHSSISAIRSPLADLEPKCASILTEPSSFSWIGSAASDSTSQTMRYSSSSASGSGSC